MTINNKYFVCLIFELFLLIDYTFAQSSSNTYFYTKEYSEEKISDFSSLLKTDLFSILESDVPIIFEKRFSDKFTLEGISIILKPLRYHDQKI